MNERSTLAQSATSQEERLQSLVRASRELALLKRDELARRARDLFLRSSGFSEFSLWVLDPRTEALFPWTLCNTPVMGRREADIRNCFILPEGLTIKNLEAAVRYLQREQ